MRKAVLAWCMMFLVVSGLFAAGQTETTSNTLPVECNLWCKVKSVFSGNVVGNK